MIIVWTIYHINAYTFYKGWARFSASGRWNVSLAFIDVFWVFNNPIDNYRKTWYDVNQDKGYVKQAILANLKSGVIMAA